MKLVSYTTKKKDRLGIYLDGKIYDVEECAAGMGFELPRRMRRFLEGGDEMMNKARQIEASIKEGRITSFAIDTARGKIYWTEDDNDRIRRSNLDGTGVATVLTTGLFSDPSGIALGPAVQGLTYSIIGGNTGGAFAINALTGAITVNTTAALNYETTPTFALTVRAVDAGGMAGTGTITVNLTNVNEAATGTVTIGGSAVEDQTLTANTAGDQRSGRSRSVHLSVAALHRRRVHLGADCRRDGGELRPRRRGRRDAHPRDRLVPRRQRDAQHFHERRSIPICRSCSAVQSGCACRICEIGRAPPSPARFCLMERREIVTESVCMSR